MQIELLAVTEKAEELIEFAARVCYRSHAGAQEGSAGKFIARLLAMGHESPLEHACATFHLQGCSRAMTHQLVRHRLMSVSQQSQRYVTEAGFEYVTPPALDKEDGREYDRDMETIRAMYAKWKARGLKNEDARFVLPNACASTLVITANFREFRHIFRLRCARHAQWEIREACTRMLRLLQPRAPAVFADLMELID
ncbi:MAG: FAD-dependent thymidylate synthase [Kiritimatiellia bacterium]|nr:FAD-dependent thymidylate synthase [Lentisphaerota bacterium]